MKFFQATSFLFLTGTGTGVQAFSPTSFTRHYFQPRSATPPLQSAAGSEDAYASLLNNLNSASNVDISNSMIDSSSSSTQKALIDAITSASDAANAAAAASARLSSALSSSSSSSTTSSTSEAILQAQNKLTILQQNLASSLDPHTYTASSSSYSYNNVISEALDASLQASQHTISSTMILKENLLHLDVVLAQSMELYHDQFHYFIPMENWQAANDKMALLIHNLIHADSSWGFQEVGKSIGANVADVTAKVYNSNDAFIQGVLAEMDRKLDSLTVGHDASLVSSMIMYATLALVVGYSQRQVGVDMYKSELREKLEKGDYDIDMLAKDVGLPMEAAATINTEVQRILDQSEPVVASVAAAAATSVKEDEIIKKDDVAKEPNVVLEDPALAMASMKTPKAGTGSPVEKASVQLPTPPKEEPALDVMAAAMDVLIPNAKDDAALKESVQEMNVPTTLTLTAEEDQENEVGATNNIMMELAMEPKSTASKKKINVVTTKTALSDTTATAKQPPKKSTIKPKSKPRPQPKLPPASPLARLLAEELGLELTSIGKGSGKNGKILIDDVRTFQARLEKAKRSITKVGSYFATVNP